METKKTFADLGLSAEMLKAIDHKGFEEPTTIQAMTIPAMLADKANIIAQAQTGTGKTAAFGLPLLQLIEPSDRSVQALILVPTRELANQVSEEIHSLRGDRDIRIVPIYGGQSIDQQLRRLSKGVHVVVGTPGRVLDHLNRGTLKLDRITHLILDEADEMLNMGFMEDMEEIMQHTNPQKRTLLFSATMPNRIRDLARKYMDGYELLSTKQESVVTNLTEQIYFEVRLADKFEALCRIIDIEDEFYGIVFCRTKSDADSLANHLLDRGYDAEPIHGDITQMQRERTLEGFRKKRINVLVATDVAARGIDVNSLTHVINYSLPHDPESYIHRIGRTGRAGNEGTAITFITPAEYRKLMFIGRIARADIKKASVPQVKDIIKAKRKKIYEELMRLVEEGIHKSYRDWAERLLVNHDPVDILSAVLSHAFEEELNPEAYGEIQAIEPRGRQVDRQGKARLFVALGKKDNATPSRLVNMIMSRTALEPHQIGAIQVMDTFSFITVPFEKAEEIVQSFREKGRKPLISHAKAGRGSSGGTYGKKPARNA